MVERAPAWASSAATGCAGSAWCVCQLGGDVMTLTRAVMQLWHRNDHASCQQDNDAWMSN